MTDAVEARRAYLLSRSVREWLTRFDRAERLTTRQRPPRVRLSRRLFRERGER